jgi:hypothetical protein
MSLERYTDLQLLAELIRRNGTAAAPWQVVRGSPYTSVLVAIGKNHTAEIVMPEEAFADVA